MLNPNGTRLCVYLLVTTPLLMLNGCEWIGRGSNPDPVVTMPPVLEAPEVMFDQAAKLKKPPIAKRLDSRLGFVFNPYTSNIVDVRGINSGQLVRDPDDPDVAHTFYVP